MRVVFYLDCVSPHQVPLAREVVKRVGMDNFRYVYRDAVQEERAALGWQMSGDADWFVQIGKQQDVARDWIETADVMLTGFRDFELFDRRVDKGLVTFYMSERWLKPIVTAGCSFPGRVRLLHPRFRRMVRAMTRCFRSEKFRYLPIGVHAQKDMTVLCGAQVVPHMMPWGYFIESFARAKNTLNRADSTCRILWVGRMLALKGVDTIVKAFRQIYRNAGGAELTLVGEGPERNKLESLSQGLPVRFLPFQPIDAIHRLMSDYDVFVFASNAQDGWGAVVNEALEAGLHVLGTHESGAAATMLGADDLFLAGDWRRLSQLMMRCVNEKRAGTLKGQGIGEWSAEKAADRLLSLINDVRDRFCEKV